MDVFFVLSGFLVSGLLFKEWQRHGAVDSLRFLGRRGLKIYPAFYVFLSVSVIGMFALGSPPTRNGLLGEMIFLQNYVGSIWWHTWSLAVEEHFYIALAVLVWWLLRRPGRLRALPGLLALVAVLALLARLRLWAVPYDHGRHLFPTHLRIDALSFGALIAYWWHFDHDRSRQLCSRLRTPALLLGILLLMPPFVWQLETTPFIYTVGLTTNYIGAGLILIALLTVSIPSNAMTRMIGLVGRHSYSIYLWHLPVILWLRPSDYRLLGFDDPTGGILFSMVASLAVGIPMASLVEAPVLRIRNRLLPSRSGTVASY